MELADLDLVAVCQHRPLHRFPVDIGAVEAADVDDSEFAVLQAELGVPSADGDVVEDDVTAGMSASGCEALIQQEPGTGIGAALDDKKGRATRKALRGRNVGFDARGGRSVQLVQKVSWESRRGVPAAYVRLLIVILVAHLLFLVGRSGGYGWLSSLEPLLWTLRAVAAGLIVVARSVNGASGPPPAVPKTLSGRMADPLPTAVDQ